MEREEPSPLIIDQATAGIVDYQFGIQAIPVYISPDYAYISITRIGPTRKIKPLPDFTDFVNCPGSGQGVFHFHRNVDQVSPYIYLDEYAYIYIYISFLLSLANLWKIFYGWWIFSPKKEREKRVADLGDGWKRRVAGSICPYLPICF